MTRLPFLNTARCATRAVVAVAGIVSRADWMTQPTASRNVTSFFPVNIAPDAFVDLPAPPPLRDAKRKFMLPS